MAAVGDDDCSQYLGGVKRAGGVKRGVGDGERLRREQGGAVPFPEECGHGTGDDDGVDGDGDVVLVWNCGW